MKKLQFVFVCIAIISYTGVGKAQTITSANQTETEDESEEEGGRSMQTSCGGTELWSLKVLTDPAATTVNYTPVASTVAALVALTTPTPSTTMPRTGPVEKTTYIITCKITIKKVETDNDYHLVLSDGTHTLIGEIPDPNCTAALTSSHRAEFAAAKAFIDAHIASGNVMSVSMAQVTVTGVGFIDPPHGQTGAAPNNLELHPILDIHFASANVPPVANFIASTTACAGQAIQLTDNSTNGPTSWNWTMSGGTSASSTMQNPSVTYNTAGAHTITLISHNSAGASAPVSHSIIVNQVPPTPIITANGNILTSNVPSKDQWYLNGVLITGDTIPIDTATQSGLYKVIATNTYGCSSSSAPVNITTTDIKSFTNTDALTIFPNPSNGIVTMNFSGKSELILVDVINDLGQLVYTEKINDCSGNCNKIIDMSSFKRGIYLFRIMANGNIHTKKVLLIK